MPLRLAARPPLFGLAPGGVCPAAPVARGAVRSCRPVSPLPAGRVAATCTGGVFSVALSLGSPPPEVIRHRIPVEPGLSSTACAAAAVRPSGSQHMLRSELEFNPESGAQTWQRTISWLTFSKSGTAATSGYASPDTSSKQHHMVRIEQPSEVAIQRHDVAAPGSRRICPDDAVSEVTAMGEHAKT